MLDSSLGIAKLNMGPVVMNVFRKIKDPLIVSIHFSITFLMYISIVCSIVFVLTSSVNFHINEFFMHSLRHLPYFFSYWVSVTQFIYFNLYTGIDLINFYGRDSIRLSKLKSKLHTFANYLLFTLVFPLSLVVAVVFWGFYAWNREYIYPKLIDEFYPVWLNHVMHSLPVPLSILYMALANNDAPPLKHTMGGLAAFLFVYSALFFRIKIIYGHWIYPLLNYLSPGQVQATLSFVIVSSFVFAVVGHHLNAKIRSIRLSLEKRA